MPLHDIASITVWWTTILLIGFITFPISSILFSSFIDKGYVFSKILGIIIVSYLVYFYTSINLLSFSTPTIFLITWILLLLAIVVVKRKHLKKRVSSQILLLIVLEELLFIATFVFWSYIRAHQPDINGLEKFMDFGFVNSILRSNTMPPVDMWFPPFPINYYYFGHFMTAVLTKLSFIPSPVTYNLMIATLFAFSFTASFSIILNLFSAFKAYLKHSIIGGFLGAFFVSMGGNLHTIYSFFAPYDTDHPRPFWELPLLPLINWPNQYWYPNATRFIPFTIHEFPIYSFVVSDLHGHVIGIPIILTIIALLFSIVLKRSVSFFSLIVLALLLSCAYMTNAWDLPIYLLLSFVVFFFVDYLLFPFYKTKEKEKIRLLLLLKNKNKFFTFLFHSTLTLVLVTLFTLPFNIHFKPFASGIGVLCAPEFLLNIGSIGPFLFERDHCQHSTYWELLTLYGFFYFFVFLFIGFLILKKRFSVNTSDFFVLILIFISTLLIIIPEFVYAKDIYPDHYRANTMFKLVYQSFIMLSISTGYIIVRTLGSIKRKSIKIILILLILPLNALVLIYPYFAIDSYYNSLKEYKGLNGITYLSTTRPDDYKAIQWINENITGQPVILEAQGDSYTDYGRISVNTGVPTVLGWTVHEWLWRGSYNIPAPRIDDIQHIYESPNLKTVIPLLDQYDVEYVYVGDLEREKYPNLQEEKFRSIGEVVFEEGNSRLYRLSF